MVGRASPRVMQKAPDAPRGAHHKITDAGGVQQVAFMASASMAARQRLAAYSGMRVDGPVEMSGSKLLGALFSPAATAAASTHSVRDASQNSSALKIRCATDMHYVDGFGSKGAFAR
jgi:hypothetical protein